MIARPVHVRADLLDQMNVLDLQIGAAVIGPLGLDGHVGIGLVPGHTIKVVVILSAGVEDEAVPGENLMIDEAQGLIVPGPQFILGEMAGVAVGNQVGLIRKGCRRKEQQTHHQADETADGGFHGNPSL